MTTRSRRTQRCSNLILTVGHTRGRTRCRWQRINGHRNRRLRTLTDTSRLLGDIIRRRTYRNRRWRRSATQDRRTVSIIPHQRIARTRRRTQRTRRCILTIRNVGDTRGTRIRTHRHRNGHLRTLTTVRILLGNIIR